MRLIALALLAASLAWPQVASDANKGYRTEEGRARVAATLGSHDREARQKPKELIARLGLAQGMTVADIGTGVGFMLPYLAEAVGAPGKVIAEDIFPDFLAKAKENAAAKGLNGVQFIHGTERSAKLPAGSTDIALILDAYHHFDYPAEMLASIHAGLKPGGRLVIVDFYKRGFRDPAHIRLDDDAVAAEVQQHGFSLVESTPFTQDSQYMAIFRKK
ncbi:MAG: methyltransferase domain-containing protein [Acidobacteria bacterium]|nr:methyltransferase domain-containing protein [Acidobacteriota bacterium]